MVDWYLGNIVRRDQTDAGCATRRRPAANEAKDMIELVMLGRVAELGKGSRARSGRVAVGQCFRQDAVALR